MGERGEIPFKNLGAREVPAIGSSVNAQLGARAARRVNENGVTSRKEVTKRALFVDDSLLKQDHLEPSYRKIFIMTV